LLVVNGEELVNSVTPKVFREESVILYNSLGITGRLTVRYKRVISSKNQQ